MKNLGAISASLETSTRAREFVSLARAIALSDGTVSNAVEIADDARLSPAVKEILADRHQVYNLPANIKTAVAAGTTSDASWAAPLAQYSVVANAFLESLRHHGVFDLMLPAMRRLPFRVNVGLSTTAITGTTLPEQHAKPISKLTLSGSTLDERKAVALLIMTAELARFGNTAGGDLFAQELSAAIATATDSEFCTILIAGATSIGSSGSTAEHVRNDLRAMLAAVTTSARSRLYLLVPPAIAKVLSVLHTNAGSEAFPNVTFNGGSIAGIQVGVSDGVPTSTAILTDAQQIAAASETVGLDSSSQADVQHDTAPDSPPTSATNMQSLWQSNKVALKAERFFGCEKLGTAGVAVLTGANYLGDSPGP